MLSDFRVSTNNQRFLFSQFLLPESARRKWAFQHRPRFSLFPIRFNASLRFREPPTGYWEVKKRIGLYRQFEGIQKHSVFVNWGTPNWWICHLEKIIVKLLSKNKINYFGQYFSGVSFFAGHSCGIAKFFFWITFCTGSFSERKMFFRQLLQVHFLWQANFVQVQSIFPHREKRFIWNK